MIAYELLVEITMDRSETRIVYIKEGFGYTLNQLETIIMQNSEVVKNILDKLSASKLLKKGKDNSIDVNDIDEYEDDNPYENTDIIKYYFTLVGVLHFKLYNILFISYPKYIDIDVNLQEDSKEVIHEKMTKIFKVLEKYESNKNKDINSVIEIDENSNFDNLELKRYLIDDFQKNGTYENDINIIENNGVGTILWDKTVNEINPIFKNKKPYYTDIYTQKSVNERNNFFKKIHKSILSDCSMTLEQLNLLKLFSINPIYFDDTNMIDLEDDQLINYLEYRINQELRVQFNSRKQRILNLLLIYVKQYNFSTEKSDFSWMGTNSFNLVWEEVCSKIFNNQLEKSIKEIFEDKCDEKIIKYNEDFQNQQRLKELISKPNWYKYDRDNEKNNEYIEAFNTLIPDIVTYTDESLYIFDAKYYCINYEKDNNKITKQPGIESITKQYLYQQAFSNRLQKDIIKKDIIIYNSFLVPTDTVEDLRISFTVVLDFMKALGLADIHVISVPVEKAYDKYLSGSTYDFSNIYKKISDQDIE